MPSSLAAADTAAIAARLRAGNQAFAACNPGDSGARQPVHVVYGGAHLFKADTARKLGAVALQALHDWFPEAEALAGALGLGPEAARIRARVEAKLAREPVEDYRIDFEDGYGHRPDAEEDAHAGAAAGELAAGLAAGSLPPFCGIRVKSFSDELFPRAARTLGLFLDALLDRTGGALPAGFVVTLPKVQIPEQAAALADLLDRLEAARGLPPGAIRVELMIETPQAIFGADGAHPLRALVAAARGRCSAVHFGTYDYTAALEITAARQSMTHPACGFAKHVFQAALAGTGVRLSDGATNVLPIPRHRAAKGGPPLTAAQQAENRAAVLGAFKLHFDQARASLHGGFYQGWDLHPAQLVTRYAAVDSFFLEGLEAATARLRNFLDRAAQATRVGEVFDDAATGQGLLNFFLRGLACGALAEEDAAAAGITAAELRSRSFAQIVAGRRG